MTPAARVRSNTARSLDRALFAIGALSAFIVLIELALLLQTAQPQTAATLFLPFGFAIYVVAGLVAWRRRPSNPMGALIIWTGAAVLLGGISNTGVPVLEGIGAIFATLALAAVLHLVLAFPTGRLETAAARWTVWAGYFVSLVLQIPLYLLDSSSPYPPLAVADAPQVAAVAALIQVVAGAIVTVATVVILAGRLVRAERIHRRMLVPLLAYSIFAVLFTPIRSLVRAFVPIDPLFGEMLQFFVIAGIPIAFVFGLLRGGFPRTGGLEELGTWLGEASATDDRLADVLSHALGDPSLQLYFWSDERSAFADADGDPPPSHDDVRRGWSPITVDGDAVGAIAYDAELITDSSLVSAAGSIIAIAVERERLTADLRATRLAVLESRQLLVTAADRDRRRVAREGQEDDGRVGYVLTHLIADVDAFLGDLERVAGGDEALHPDSGAVIVGRSLREDTAVGSLTPRQKQVIALVAEGRSNASIAAKLFLTEKAVVQHVSRIYDALGLSMDAEAHRRVQAVVLYLAAQETPALARELRT
jgi:DNA-binding NarL/FixJ family response regulator